MKVSVRGSLDYVQYMMDNIRVSSEVAGLIPVKSGEICAEREIKCFSPPQELKLRLLHAVDLLCG